jgi:serine/threonine protein kinase
LLDRLRLLLAAGRELEAAHEAGLVHGDFKPSDVLVDADGVELVGFDRSGAPKTPVYEAPELIEGATPDQCSDIYAFCVVLFEAMYGVLPYRGSDVRELYREKVWRIELPSSPALTPNLRRLLGNGMDPNPYSRPASLAPLLDELETITRKRWTRHLHLVVPATMVALVALSWM